MVNINNNIFGPPPQHFHYSVIVCFCFFSSHFLCTLPSSICFHQIVFVCVTLHLSVLCCSISSFQCLVVILHLQICCYFVVPDIEGVRSKLVNFCETCTRFTIRRNVGNYCCHYSEEGEKNCSGKYCWCSFLFCSIFFRRFVFSVALSSSLFSWQLRLLKWNNFLVGNEMQKKKKSWMSVEWRFISSLFTVDRCRFNVRTISFCVYLRFSFVGNIQTVNFSLAVFSLILLSTKEQKKMQPQKRSLTQSQSIVTIK